MRFRKWCLLILLLWAPSVAIAQEYPAALASTSTICPVGEGIQVSSTLTVAITSWATTPLTVTVADNSDFPSEGCFVVGVAGDLEVMYYDAKPSSTTFTVQERGVGDTTATAHDVGNTVGVTPLAHLITRHGAEIIAIQTELGTQPRHSSASDPTVNDDSDDGYTEGSTLWHNTTDGDVFVLEDGTVGAAVWTEITGGGGGGGDMLAATYDPAAIAEQLVGLTASQTLTNKTLTSPTINSPALGADSVDAITEIASALRAGSDTTLLTGTAGTSGNCAEWNADGDLVDSGASCGGGGGGVSESDDPLAWTGQHSWSYSGVPWTSVKNTAASASVQVAVFEGDRASPAAGDEAYVSFRLSDSAGNQDEALRLVWELWDETAGTEDTLLHIYGLDAGTLKNTFYIDFGEQFFGSSLTQGPLINAVAGSRTSPSFVMRSNDKNTGLGSGGSDEVSLIVGGVEGLRVVEDGTDVYLLIDTRAAAPTGAIGVMYYDTDDGDLCIYNGSAFIGATTGNTCT